MSTKSRPTTAFRFIKAGGEEPNPLTFAAKASSAVSTITAGSTFVTVRSEHGLGHYFVTTDDSFALQAAAGLAQALSARSEPAEAPDLSDAAAIATLVFVRGSKSAVSTQNGTDIATLVDTIAMKLSPGEWVGASVRPATRTESKRHGIWLEPRTSGVQHHSRGLNALVIALWVGGASTSSAGNILRGVVSSFPGFDLQTTDVPVRKHGTALMLGAAAAAAIVLGVGAGAVPAELDSVAPWAGLSVFLYVVAGLLAVAAGLTVAGRIPSAAVRIRRRLATGLVPAPGHRLLPPSAPTKATTTAENVAVDAKDGDYPLAANTFLVGAHLPLSIIAPHAGAESGTAATKERPVPPRLRELVGPVFGMNAGKAVCLSAGDAWAGTFIVGQAGSGKSEAVQMLWRWAAADKMRPSGIPGAPGSRHTMIGIDTKGDGATANTYVNSSRAVGDNVIRFDVADTASAIGIQLFGTTGSAVQRARDIVNGLVYVYGETSIGPQSSDTLNRLLAAALVVTPDVASQVDDVAASMSPFYYANILLTNRGDELGIELAAAITSKAVREKAAPGSDLFDAAEGLKPVYEKTVAQRSALLSAPKTKVAPLMVAEQWWSRPQQATWAQLIDGHHSIVINLGMSQNGHTLDSDLAESMSALIMFSLHGAMKGLCAGWGAQGRTVSIYADELKHLAKDSADILTWIREDGRAAGVRAVFATQYPEQLAQAVRDSALGFGTFITFAQQNPDMCASIVTKLANDGSAWTTADVAQLPAYEAIVKTTVDKTGQPAFTVSVPNFRALDRDAFAVFQGLPN